MLICNATGSFEKSLEVILKKGKLQLLAHWFTPTMQHVWFGFREAVELLQISSLNAIWQQHKYSMYSVSQRDSGFPCVVGIGFLRLSLSASTCGTVGSSVMLQAKVCEEILVKRYFPQVPISTVFEAQTPSYCYQMAEL